MNEYNNNNSTPEENGAVNEAPENTAPLSPEINTAEPSAPETTPEKAQDLSKKSSFEINPAPADPTLADIPPYTPPYVPRESAEPLREPAPAQYAQAPTETQQTQPQYTRPPVDPAAKAGAVPPPPMHPADRGGIPPHAGPADRGQGFNHSGEYRYVPPYAGVGANTPGCPPKGATPPPPPRNEQPPKKKEKQKTVRTFPTVALVFILIGSVLLSFASGMAGALLVGGGFKTGEPSEIVENDNNDNDDNSGLVINKNDKDDESSSSATVGGTYDLSEICALVSASVVEITTEFNQTYYGYYQYVQEGAGSGVIISEDGYLLTNAHVITDTSSGKIADTIKVRLTSGDEYTAKMIGSDTDSDIALLKIDGKDLTAVTVGNSDSIKVGEQILAVGNPLGELGGTVTSGIVSATNREISVENNKMTLIQIDAAINPGNSGGGLFNTKGELIGIVNAKTTDVTVEGLGFAIPVNEAIRVAEELESHGYVTGKTYIGVSLTDVTDSYSAYYYFRSDSVGVYIVNVQEGYNDKVLAYGDRITAIEGNEVTSSEDVKEAISNSKVGDKLTFTISREGKLVEVEVTCYEYVPEEDVSFNEE